MSVTVIATLALMSATVITRLDDVGRWTPDAQGRLRQAALSLYRERGFEQTTVADIAERAGVTERTFFRHFADKREVLFGGETELRDTMVDAITGAAPGTSPLDLVVGAYRAAVPLSPAAEARILSRQLLYTGLSRARASVELWTADASLQKALATPAWRMGGLMQRLCDIPYCAAASGSDRVDQARSD